ncbi:hypothetical protein Hanom_Chr13g01186701 [Helianthus anomalus]
MLYNHIKLRNTIVNGSEKSWYRNYFAFSIYRKGSVYDRVSQESSLGVLKPLDCLLGYSVA